MTKSRTEPTQESNSDQQPSTDKNRTWPWSKILLYTALAATLAGALYSTKILNGVEKKIAEAKEMARPATIKLTKITASSCAECFNIDNAISILKTQNVKVDSEKTVEFNSPEGVSLIKKLGIKRLPAYTLTGEIGKKNFEDFVKKNGTIKDDTFIFTQVNPVFIDSASQEPQGKVTVTYLLDSSCTQCVDPRVTGATFKESGIVITGQNEIEWDSVEGQDLISTYQITKLPTFILSSEINAYDNVKANASRIGTFQPDGTLVARNLNLPYRDLEKGQIEGLVDLVYLIDSSCEQCFKPEETHKNILTQGFGVGLRSERTVDVNSPEGQNVVDQYKITAVPTILLSPDADKYESLKAQWASVGSIEPDGLYVFRELKAMGPVVYKDLSSNQVMNLVAPTTSPQQ